MNYYDTPSYDLGPNVRPYHLDTTRSRETFARETYLTNDEKFDEAVSGSGNRIFATGKGILEINAYAKWDEFLKLERAGFKYNVGHSPRQIDTWLAGIKCRAEKKVEEILTENRKESFRTDHIDLAKSEPTATPLQGQPAATPVLQSAHAA